MTEISNNQPATKGDLADLRVELKTDINRIDQKIGQMDQKIGQLDTTVRSLCGEMLKIRSRMDRLEHNIIEALRSCKSDLISAFEASVVKGRLYSQKAVTRGDILSGHEEKLLNHETRVA
ncbi:MAG: hypothetical protein Q8O90_05790 [Elusimicrobiota bacterium]|nr:hypothetical protein [Elusimicrobiota bacterium]